MSTEKGNPKHSVGQGAQKEHHNEANEDSYVNNPKENKAEDDDNDGDYLEQKWKKIAKDFKKNYNMEVSGSDVKDESFSDTLKQLETKTGKSRADLEKEIKNWKNS